MNYIGGFADIANEIPNTFETRFASASMGKTFIAVGILQLLALDSDKERQLAPLKNDKVFCIMKAQGKRSNMTYFVEGIQGSGCLLYKDKDRRP